MAEKISVIIVKVDLDCHKCYNKMRKILCKLQDQERISTISFDDRSKTVTIVGPFDPLRLVCRIRCKGGKVVKDVQIVDAGCGKPPPPPPAPANNGKQKHKEKHPPPPPPPPVPEPEPEPEPAHELLPPPPDREMSTVVTVTPFVEERKPNRRRPAEMEPPPPFTPREKPMDLPMPISVPVLPPPVKERPVEYVIPTVEIPSWPAAPLPCGCSCCAPCCQGYCEGCRCCGKPYGYAARPLLPPPECGYRVCRVVCDDEPAAGCNIM